VTTPNRLSVLRGPNGNGRSSVDAPVLVAGGVLSGALSVGAALLFAPWANTASDVGPTAASLEEAFGQLVGALIGLTVGTATVASAVRRGRRLLSGLFAGLLGYAIVLAPALIISAPSDVSTGESVFIAVFVAILLTPAMLVGAALGAGIAACRKAGPSNGIADRRESPPPPSAGDSRRERPLRLVALAALLAVAAIGVAVVVRSSHQRAASHFDARVWKHPVESCSNSPRGSMVDDLVRNRLPAGMSMRRVRGLLGAPEEINADGTWVYDVDAEDEYSFLPTCLTLQLYPNGGRLESVYVGRDS
jgi:hypothetical protein